MDKFSTPASTHSANSTVSNSNSNSSPRPLLRPITRLLPTRPRLQIASAPAARGGTDSGSILPELHFRPHASLPIRKSRSRRSRSCSPPPRVRRQRMALRFPKHSGDRPNRDVSLDAMDDFFDSFAPPSIHSFKRLYYAMGSPLASTTPSTASASDSAPNMLTTSAPARSCAPASEDQPAPQSPQVQTRDARAQPPSTRTSCSHELSTCIERSNRVHAEISMLRRLLQAELRESRGVEDARYSALAESVQEAVRLVTVIEGRIDAMRVSQRDTSPPRPSVVLATLILDTIASVILFCISFFIARPFSFIRRAFSRTPPIRTPHPEPKPRISRSWRLSGRDFDDPFLGTVAKRISYSAATAFAE